MFPALRAPALIGTGFTHRVLNLAAHVVLPVADAEADSYMSSPAALAGDGRFACGPLWHRPDNSMSKGKLSLPNAVSLFSGCRSHFWKAASLAYPARLPIDPYPTFPSEKQYQP